MWPFIDGSHLFILSVAQPCHTSLLQEVNATIQQLQDAISSETLLRETQEMLGFLDRNRLYSSQLCVDYRTLHQEWLIRMIF